MPEPSLNVLSPHAELLRDHPDEASKMLFMTGGVFVEEAEEFLSKVSGR